MDDSVREELIGLANDWDRAMVENDAEAIGQYMADDWTIIGSDGSVGDKATFLGLVKSGALSHDVMESDDLTVRVYGDAAVVTARGVSGGTYQGQAFRELERSSSVFVRQEGQWRCVLTHLSRIAQKEEDMVRAPASLVRSADEVSADPVQAGTGTTRQVLIGPDEAPHFALRRFVMQPGGGMPRHTNTVEHEQYVLRGRAAIAIGERVVDVQPGSVLFIPAGTPHAYTVKGEEPFEFLCVVPNLPDEIRLAEGGEGS